jgi:hypothetical protein
LARSWLQPAKLKNISKGFHSEGYSRDQRAYVLAKETKQQVNLEFELPASDESPVVNPAFVIKNWGEAGVALKINGRNVPRGTIFRLGHRRSIEGGDLVVWLMMESVEPVRILLSPRAD